MEKIRQKDIEEFKNHLIQEEKSEGTIDKYLRDVKNFAAWMQNCDISKEAASAWKHALMEGGKASTTVNSMIAAVNKFLRFKGRSDCCIKSIRIQKRFFRGKERELTKDEYERLLRVARGSGRSRLALVMETICATGIRVSELKYITVEAVNRGRAEVSLKGKNRVILIPDKLCRKLQVYVKKTMLAAGPIFVNRYSRSIDRRQIWAEMKALCRLAGIEERKVFPHNLRHLFARCFYNIAEDIVSLANILGHSSIETTRIYLVSTEYEHNKKIAQMNLVL